MKSLIEEMYDGNFSDYEKALVYVRGFKIGARVSAEIFTEELEE